MAPLDRHDDETAGQPGSVNEAIGPHTAAEELNQARNAVTRLIAESEQQQRLFDAILSATPDLVYVFDLNHRFAYANRALLAMWGRTWEGAIGKNCLELGYEPWHAAMHDREIDQVIATRQPIRGEVPFNGTNGRRIYDYIFVPVFGEKGEVEAIAGTTRDITERKQSEEALRESAERLRSMAESLPQKIFQARANGEIEYLNGQWIVFAGLSIQELKRSGWVQLVHPDDLGESAQRWRRSLETGEHFEAAHRLRRADGVYCWHLSRIRALRDSHGKVSMWIGSSTDIQQERDAQEELRRANADLNQFAFAAGHDLREPLRMITSYSQLLVRRCAGQLDTDASQYFGYVIESAQRMSELICALLSYIQAGADSEEYTEFVDFNAVFEKAKQNLQAAIAESGAAVTCDRLPVVRGREGHFLQLLQNLIGNGIKYRAEHPSRVHVSAERQGTDWLFAVADNGMGIAPRHRHEIFGVFKRLHGTNVPGAGIGLAICQRVVERHGGRIWVESQPGQGATFFFTLPAASMS